MKRDLFSPEHPLRPCSYEDWKNAPHSHRFNQFKPFFHPQFEAFLNTLTARGFVVGLKMPLEGYVFSDDQAKHDKGPDVFLSHEYITGGTGSDDGGNTVHRWTEDNIGAKENIQWKNIMLMFWPDITAEDIKQLSSLVLSECQWNVNEYYGDSSDYVAQVVDLQKLFVVLQAENKLTPHDLPSSSLSRFQAHLQNHDQPLVEMAPPKAPKP